MLSRVADSFYWMSRYLERAEHSARVLAVHASLTLDNPTERVGRSLIAAFDTGAPSDDGPSALVGGGLDDRHRAVVIAAVVAARENARQIREQISTEMWEQLNSLYLDVRDNEPEGRLDPGLFLRMVVEGAHLFHGVTDGTLSHGEGWQHLQLGRYIERATATADMLEAYFAEPTDADGGQPAAARYVEWVGLLRACCAFEAYCRCYTADIRPERLAEFLLLNAEFPRSVRFAADRIEESLREIARALGQQATRPERFAGRLRAALNFGTIDEIIDDSLIGTLESIGRQCSQIHHAVYQTYITYSIEAAVSR